jgi:sulfoquinovosidase
MIPLSAVLALTACKRTADVDGAWVLPDGTEVVLTGDGGLELRALGRATFALAGPPEARTFEELVDSGLGQYTFARSEEARAPLALGEVSATAGGVRVELQGGALTISPDGPGRTRFVLTADDPHQSLAVPARCDAEATFHGFGEQYHATDHRGERFPLLVSEQGIGRDEVVPFYSGNAHTTYFPMPYWLDARGFGVLVDTHHRVEADLCATDPERAWIESVDGGDMAWVVLHGDTPLDVIRQLGDVVGRPAAPPSWAYGAWICAQGGRDAVLAQADLLEAEGIPAAALWVQDWTGSAVNIGGGYGVNYRWAPDEGELYPDLPGLVDELHARGFRVLGYVNPFVDPGLPDHFDEMAQSGWLPLGPDGEPYLFLGPRGEMTQADLTHEGAREYIRGFLRAAVDDVGLDGWMADFAEWLPLDARVADGSDPVAAHNGAPESWQRLTREVMDEARPDGDWVMFARSGWTGVQAVAQIHWAGDQEADFSPTDGLPTVVPAMLSLGLSGQPNVTHDVAGFSGGPSTEELYLRWIELGAFTPILRTHDGNARADNWRFDRNAETLAFFRRFVRVHEALRPEIEALAAEAAQTGAPVVRHLMLDHPDDRETFSLSDQYLLGPDLLVAPVVEEGALTRELYLPEGRWFHVWTGEAHDGPGWITVDAPIGSPPVFSRGADRADLRALE